jgi:hypothetical protein
MYFCHRDWQKIQNFMLVRSEGCFRKRAPIKSRFSKGGYGIFSKKQFFGIIFLKYSFASDPKSAYNWLIYTYFEKKSHLVFWSQDPNPYPKVQE